MLRLFVAVDLPDSLRTRLGAFQHDLPGARWVQPDALHITLRFIGEVNADTAAAVDEALLGLPPWDPFPLTVAGVGQFPKQGMPRVLWAGVEPSAPLSALADAVEQAVRDCGLPADGKPFTPHVTLARFKADPDRAKLRRFYERAEDFLAAPFTVDQCVLYRSQLTPQGPRYTPRVVVPASPTR